MTHSGSARRRQPEKIKGPLSEGTPHSIAFALYLSSTSVDLYRSPLATYPPSRLGKTPDGDPTRPDLQSYVEYRDRTDVREEIQEIPARFLANFRSEVTLGHDGAPDGTIDLQAVDDEHQENGPLVHPIPPFLTSSDFFFVPQPAPYGPSLDQEDGLLTSFRVTGSMSEDTDPRRARPDLLPYGTSGPTSYEPVARDFPPQRSTYSEWQTSSGSSPRHDQPPPPLTVQGRQNKVQCSRPGCIAVVNKDNLTRHVNEVHERKVKARCNRCGKGFARPYMRDEHIRRVKCENIIIINAILYGTDAILGVSEGHLDARTI